jgi:hypothetical protein
VRHSCDDDDDNDGNFISMGIMLMKMMLTMSMTIMVSSLDWWSQWNIHRGGDDDDRDDWDDDRDEEVNQRGCLGHLITSVGFVTFDLDRAW